MLYKKKVTDEFVKDLSEVSVSRYEYYGNEASGEKAITEFEIAVDTLGLFPLGFRGISVFYRNYEIHLMPYKKYNVFYIINEKDKIITILRLLDAKTDWLKTLKTTSEYHIVNMAV